jgi:hypothetical protein
MTLAEGRSLAESREWRAKKGVLSTLSSLLYPPLRTLMPVN